MSQVYELVVATLRASCRLDRITTDHEGWKLEQVQADEYLETAFTYASVATRLTQLCEASERKLFHVTTKLHAMCHVSMFARFIHPQLMWNYVHEDYVLYIRRSCQRNVHGSSQALTSRKMMEHFLQAKHIDMAPRDMLFR